LPASIFGFIAITCIDYEINVFELTQPSRCERALANARAIGLLEQHGGRVKW